MLPNNTIHIHNLLEKILVKKPVFLVYSFNFLGIASVSQPSFIILRAPKHAAKVCLISSSAS